MAGPVDAIVQALVAVGRGSVHVDLNFCLAATAGGRLARRRLWLLLLLRCVLGVARRRLRAPLLPPAALAAAGARARAAPLPAGAAPLTAIPAAAAATLAAAAAAPLVPPVVPPVIPPVILPLIPGPPPIAASVAAAAAAARPPRRIQLAAPGAVPPPLPAAALLIAPPLLRARPPALQATMMPVTALQAAVLPAAPLVPLWSRLLLPLQRRAGLGAPAGGRRRRSRSAGSALRFGVIIRFDCKAEHLEAV